MLQQGDLVIMAKEREHLKYRWFFYLAYIREHLLYVNLRRGLEVCGILADVYVSRNLNVKGHIFGFAKFLKVCHVEKLNKSLNNVLFRDNSLFTKMAKFDSFRNSVRSGGGLGDGEKSLRQEGEKNVKVGAGKNPRERLEEEMEVWEGRKFWRE